MKKQILPLFLLAFTLASCGSEKTPTSTPKNQVSSQKSEQETTSEKSASSSQETFEEKLEDGNLVFPASAPSEIAKAKEGDISFLASAKIPYSLVNSNSCTMANVTITSSDHTVIPESAITFEHTNGSNADSIIIGGEVIIDLTQVQLGECFIRIAFQGLNGNSPKGTITKKLTVVNYGEVKTVHFEQTVTFDFKKVSTNLDLLKTSSISLRSDAPYGSDVYLENKSVAVDVTGSTSQSITFNAMPNVNVYLSVAYQDADERYHFFNLTQKETKGSDYTYTVNGTSAVAVYGNSTAAKPLTITVLDSHS